jgi:Na+/proline symporter
MAGSAVPPHSLLGLRKGHEMVTLLAFVSLCLGLVSLMYCSLEQRFSRRRRGKARRARTSAALLAGGAVLPMLLAGLAQTYVFYVLPNLPWVSPAWRARRVPVVLSFAFWEWVTTAVVSAYFAALVLMADGDEPAEQRSNGI